MAVSSHSPPDREQRARLDKAALEASGGVWLGLLRLSDDPWSRGGASSKDGGGKGGGGRGASGDSRRSPPRSPRGARNTGDPSIEGHSSREGSMSDDGSGASDGGHPEVTMDENVSPGSGGGSGGSGSGGRESALTRFGGSVSVSGSASAHRMIPPPLPLQSPASSAGGIDSAGEEEEGVGTIGPHAHATTRGMDHRSDTHDECATIGEADDEGGDGRGRGGRGRGAAERRGSHSGPSSASRQSGSGRRRIVRRVDRTRGGGAGHGHGHHHHLAASSGAFCSSSATRVPVLYTGPHTTASAW